MNLNRQIVEYWTPVQMHEHWARRAEEISTFAHAGQLRRGGEAYINHPRRVADKVPLRLKPIAWLHDSIEDQPLIVTLDILRKEGFPPYVIRAIDAITHKDGDSNIVYWNKILTNPDAVIVKLYDIQDNLADNPSDTAREKYARALELFKQHGYSI